MAPQTRTAQQYLKTLQIIHLAMLAGQLLFLLVVAVLDLSPQNIDSFKDIESILLVAIPAVVFSGIIAGELLLKNSLPDIRQQTALGDKLFRYREKFILKMALLEGPALLSIIGFLLTKNYLFAGLAIIIVLLFLSKRPTIDRISNDLELNLQERSHLQRPDAVIEDVGR